MPLALWKKLEGSSRRGFSLVESAIVVGVVGMLVAGLYGLIGPTRSEVKINRAIDELNAIASNMRNYYSGRGSPTGLKACAANMAFNSIHHLPSPPGAATWDYYRDLGVFPQTMLDNATGTVYLRHSLSSTANVDSVDVELCSLAGLNRAHFAVRFRNIASKDCVGIIARTSGLTSGINLSEIWVDGVRVPPDASGMIGPMRAMEHCTNENETIVWLLSL